MYFKFLNKPIPKRVYIETKWLRKLVAWYLIVHTLIGYLIFWKIFPRYHADGSLNPWYFVFLPVMLLCVLITFVIFYCFVGYVEKFFLKKPKNIKR